MNKQRTTPYGLWRYGNDFRRAALAVGSMYSERGFMPFYFLLGQSIELFLKSFLFGRGISLGELKRKPYGHDLKALLSESRRRQLGKEAKLKPVHCATIEVLGIEYLSRRF